MEHALPGTLMNRNKQYQESGYAIFNLKGQ
jgi:hypothetical protein